MRGMAMGVAILAASFAGPASGAESLQDEIQDEEQPGSEIEVDIGRGGVNVERKSGKPLLPLAPGGGAAVGSELQPLNDPDSPVGSDPVDAELPGEGPEDLSGPDDDDPLPE
jgi:hypothetical protein